MKIKEIGPYKGNIITTILSNRGIVDIDTFLNPSPAHNTNITNIKDVEAAAMMLSQAIVSRKKIGLLVDSDCDGFTSSSIIFQYIKSIDSTLDIEYFIHDIKAHGLTNEFMRYVEEKDLDLIIVPDAGTNDYEQLEKLCFEQKRNVIIIDHHDVEKVNPNTITINNKLDNEINENLTGAGLSYVFCKYLDTFYKTGMADKLIDLAMLGQVGDSSDLSEPEVRYICQTGLKNINNNLIKAFYTMNEKGTENLIIKDLSFSGIIPMINAIIRVGTLEEKYLLFEALSNITTGRCYIVPKRKLNKETRKYEIIDFEFDEFEYVVDLGAKVKARQDKISKDTMKTVSSQFRENAGIQFFILEDACDATKGVTGLIANKLVSSFKQPCIAAWLDDNGVYKGSLRGTEKVLQDFKQWCLDTELFDLVQGHPNAAGIELKKENLEKVLEKMQTIEQNEKCYEVDKIYNKLVNVNDITDVDDYRGLWYGGCEEPLFAVKNISISKGQVQLNKSTMKFYLGGVSFIKFQGKDDYNEIVMKTGFSERVTLNLVGKFDINRWNGKAYPQFVIEDYEIIKEEEITEFDFIGVDIASSKDFTATATPTSEEEYFFSVFS